MKHYAAYGSNMNLDQMQQRCPDAIRIGVGMIRNYTLRFCNVATIQKCKGKYVPVVIWGITEECEKRLDRYEGYPKLYIKENVAVELQGEKVVAMAYILTEPYCDREAMPNECYWQTIEQGYRQNDISYHGLLPFKP